MAHPPHLIHTKIQGVGRGEVYAELQDSVTTDVLVNLFSDSSLPYRADVAKGFSLKKIKLQSRRNFNSGFLH